MKYPARFLVCRFLLMCGFAALAVTPSLADEVVFIRAAAPLDEPRGLCIDIPGHRDRVDVSASLVVHTCKWGIWNHDERFDRAAIARGELRMPDYSLCVGAVSADENAKLVLSACDGDPLRMWTWSDGQLRLQAAMEMCLTVGRERSRLTRGGRRLPSRHVARSLALNACRDTDRDRQVWELAVPGR